MNRIAPIAAVAAGILLLLAAAPVAYFVGFPLAEALAAAYPQSGACLLALVVPSLLFMLLAGMLFNFADRLA